MNILTEPELFPPEVVRRMEDHYQALYVCETCLKGGGGWINSPVAIFYQDDDAMVPEGGSNYFGMYMRDGHLMICNAISALEPIEGIVAENGDVIYSHYRHDYRVSPDESVWIDGGRDYVRTGGLFKFVELQIVDDKLVGRVQ